MNLELPDAALDALADAIASRLAPRLAGHVAASAKVTRMPEYVNREDLERELGYAVKERWLRERVREGMPHRLIAGKMRFRVAEVLPWLERRGYIERRGEAA